MVYVIVKVRTDAWRFIENIPARLAFTAKAHTDARNQFVDTMLQHNVRTQRRNTTLHTFQSSARNLPAWMVNVLFAPACAVPSVSWPWWEGR